MANHERTRKDDDKIEQWGPVRVHNNEHVEVLQGDSLWRIAKASIEHQKPGETAKPKHINEAVDEYKKVNDGKIKADGTIYPTAHTGEYLTIPPLFKQADSNKDNKTSAEGPKAENKSRKQRRKHLKIKAPPCRWNSKEKAQKRHRSPAGQAMNHKATTRMQNHPVIWV
ncbi:MAG: hypothetical protein IPM93_12720 [Candidatus Obscuribacter sp.]|nr:hypothetical protein [Candidatus Obscuribacter sp.]